MAELPVISGADAFKAFGQAGWRVDRRRGSHDHAESRPDRQSVSSPASGASSGKPASAH
jgi:predicted RNA binding protein YcfA (HicA-like mRNA interferase family)